MRNLERKNQRSVKLLTGMEMLFFFAAFLLLYAKTLMFQYALMAAAVPLFIWIGVRGVSRLIPADPLLLAITHFLCALGVLMLSRMNIQRGLSQSVNYLVGVGGMILCTVLVRNIKKWKIIAVLLMLLSAGLLALPLVMGREISGAKNWIFIGSYSLQPSEIVKLCLVCVLALLFSRRKTMLALLFALMCLGFLMLQKDLGTALIYYFVTMAMLYTSSGNLLLTGIGLAGGAGAAVFGYTQFAHVRKRVAIWLDPWKDTNNTGYQVVQALIAIVNGGFFGTGLGLGNASRIPAYYNDMIFSVLLNEFGWIFGGIVLLMYAAMTLRGVMIASRAQNAMDTLMALGCAAFIAVQTFVIVAGNIKMIPLTGVTLPFISYGGTSMVSSLCLVGLLQGIAARNADALEEDKALAGYEEADT